MLAYAVGELMRQYVPIAASPNGRRRRTLRLNRISKNEGTRILL